jgi:hypothetical protein
MVNEHYIVVANAFLLNNAYIYKEMSIVGEHLKMHFKVKIPYKMLTMKLSKEDQKLRYHYETWLHGLQFKNNVFDCSLSCVRNEIKRLFSSNPGSVFWVKGDVNLRHFLRERCYVPCNDLSEHACPKAPIGDSSDYYTFCPEHVTSNCSFSKATIYYDWLKHNVNNVVPDDR